jgi:hypothetical protein
MLIHRNLLFLLGNFRNLRIAARDILAAFPMKSLAPGSQMRLSGCRPGALLLRI